MSDWPELSVERDHETLAILHLASQMLGNEFVSQPGDRRRNGTVAISCLDDHIAFGIIAHRTVVQVGRAEL